MHGIIPDKNDQVWATMDNIVVQPLLWTPINISVGPGTQKMMPRFVSVMGSKSTTVTCSVSESWENPGEWSAKAAIRNNTAPMPSVTPKAVRANSMEEAVEKCKERIQHYIPKNEPHSVFDRYWSDLEADPYVISFELRNLGTWRDPSSVNGILDRKCQLT
jgi:hypothetical protein